MPSLAPLNLSRTFMAARHTGQEHVTEKLFSYSSCLTARPLEWQGSAGQVKRQRACHKLAVIDVDDRAVAIHQVTDGL
jgi:hypothetical protein